MDCVTEKQCRICHEVKPLDAFYKTAGFTCKVCMTEYNRRKEASPEWRAHRREQKAQWKRDNPEKVREIARKCYNKRFGSPEERAARKAAKQLEIRTETHRKCRKCGEWKEHCAFSPNNTYCKPCRAMYVWQREKTRKGKS